MLSPYTQPEAWTDGSIDALMYFGKATDLALAIAHAVWSFPKLEGPYFRDSETKELLPYDYSSFGDEGSFKPLMGVVTHHDGRRSLFVHHTILDDDGLWVYAGPTVGGLPAEWNIGAYPFDDGKRTDWLVPLLSECET